MKILGIDPGTIHSAFVIFENGKILDKGILENEELRLLISDRRMIFDILVIEFIQSYGMAIGKECFETIFWCGKFALTCEQKKIPVKRIGRQIIKAFVTGITRAKDKDVRQALLLKYGGCKKGEPLQGVRKDIWSALALCDYAHNALKLNDLKEW